MKNETNFPDHSTENPDIVNYLNEHSFSQKQNKVEQFNTKKHSSQKLIAVVQIDLGEGMEVIKVYEGDDIHNIATSFCDQKNLDKGCVSMLEQGIYQELQKHIKAKQQQQQQQMMQSQQQPQASKKGQQEESLTSVQPARQPITNKIETNLVQSQQQPKTQQMTKQYQSNIQQQLQQQQAQSAIAAGQLSQQQEKQTNQQQNLKISSQQQPQQTKKGLNQQLQQQQSQPANQQSIAFVGGSFHNSSQLQQQQQQQQQFQSQMSQNPQKKAFYNSQFSDEELEDSKKFQEACEYQEYDFNNKNNNNKQSIALSSCSRQDMEQGAAQRYEAWQKLIKNKNSNNITKEHVLSKSPSIVSQKNFTLATKSPSQKAFQTNFSKEPVFNKLFDESMERRQNREEMIRQNQHKIQEKEQRELVFRPNISPHAKEVQTHQGSLEDYLIMEGRKKQERQVKANLIKEEQEKQKCTFKPYVSKESQEIINKKSVQNNQEIHERLYQQAREDEYRKDKWNQSQFSNYYPFKPDLGVNKDRPPKEKSQDEFIKRLMNEKNEKEERLLKKRIEESKPIDKKTGQKLFRPQFNKDEIYKKVSERVDQEDLLYQQKINEERQNMFNSSVSNAFSQTTRNIRNCQTPLSHHSNSSQQFFHKSPKGRSLTPKASVRYNNSAIIPNNNAINKSFTQQANQVKKTVISSEQVSPHIKGCLKEIFDLFDNDHDGIISSNNIDLSQIEADVLEIIQSVLFDMEENNQDLDFAKFVSKVVQFDLIKPLTQHYEVEGQQIMESGLQQQASDYEKTRQQFLQKQLNQGVNQVPDLFENVLSKSTYSISDQGSKQTNKVVAKKTSKAKDEFDEYDNDFISSRYKLLIEKSNN